MSDQESQPSSQRSWCWWSTHETIQNEVPSVTAILETIIAVPLYWWIALQTGWVLPLLISVAVAPFVLLRSEQSVALGVTWLLSWENASNVKTYSDLEVGQKRLVWTIVGLLAVMSFSVAYFYAYHRSRYLWDC
jgi:hypothetical protein